MVRTAKNRPTRSTRRDVDTTDFKVGQDRPRDMPTTGPAQLEPQIVEPVDGPVSKDFLDALKFMDEELTIIVQDTEDKNATPLVETWCNGRSQFFIRGQAQTVKRRYVEVLARSKGTRYRQEHYKDANGNDAIRNIPVTSLRYPFTVIHDPNPNGPEWLKQVLKEGA